MKGKKLLFVSICLALIIAAGGLIGCGGKETPTTTPTTPGGTTTPTKTTGPTPTQTTYNWKLQTSGKPGDSNWSRYEHTLKQIEDITGGRIKHKMYQSGEIVADREIFDGLKAGTVDVAGWASVYMSGFVDGSDVVYSLDWALPGFNDYLYVYFYAENNWNKLYREQVIKNGNMLLATGPDVPYGAMPSMKPIRKVEDIKGLKIRSYGLTGKILKDAGASIVTMPSAEMYTGLTLGTIDASTWTGYRATMDKKLDEIIKYYIDPPSLPWCESDTMMNLKTYNSLPKDLQNILLLAWQEHFTRGGAIIPTEDAVAKVKMQQRGTIEFITLPESECAKLRAISVKLWDTYTDPTSLAMIKTVKDYMDSMGIKYK